MKINKQTLRVLATDLDGDDWHAEGSSVYGGCYDVGDSVCYDHIASCESINGQSPHADFIAAANPSKILALLDELEAAEKRMVELEAKCAALAAESAGLKEYIADSKRAIELWNSWADVEDEIPLSAEIPDTDAFIADQRAQGVEVLTAKLQSLIDEDNFEGDEIGVIAGAVYTAADIAAQLRQGGAA